MFEKSPISPAKAALKIENYYICYRNKQLFKLLKTSICAAELSLTRDLIQKIAPLEYDFFKNDEFMKMKIKFRFGGSEYPPKVYYKIYVSSVLCALNTIRSDKTLTNSDKACYGALSNMGFSKYIGIVLNDIDEINKRKLNSKKEIMNSKEFIQYSSYIDDIPAKFGGKNNPWKKLNHNGIVTYVIPNWTEYTNKNYTFGGLPDWSQYNRIKGIFQECLANPPSTILAQVQSPYVIKNNCIDNDIGIYGTQTEDNLYTIIIRIRQSQIGVHGIALLFLLIILIMGIGIFMKWCCSFEDSSFYIKWRITLGILSFISFLCLAASSSLGTILISFENSTNYKTPKLPYSPFQMSGILVTYGYMFYLVWTGTFIIFFAAILFCISSYLGKSLELEKYKPHVVAVDNPTFLGEESKVSEPIFLKPSSSTFGITPVSIKANESNSPGLLPRYDISTFG